MGDTEHHMQKHKDVIKKLNGENVALKHKEDILNREVRGTYVHTQI